MFRKLTREKQALTIEECKELLKNEKRGVLSVSGDDNYPYGVPMDFYYNENTNSICFHSGRHGHKYESLLRNPKASFCIFDEGYQIEGEWPFHVKSVICFGQVEEITEETRKIEFLRNFGYKYCPDEKYIEHEIIYDGPHTLALELKIENMQGKLVEES